MKIRKSFSQSVAIAIGLISIMGCSSDDSESSPTAPLNYTVTSSASQGGTISPASVMVPVNTATSFTVVAEEGYSVDSVSGCNGTLERNIYTTGTITDSCNVLAEFLYINKSPTVIAAEDTGVKTLTQFKLEADATDPEGEMLQFIWTQLSGQAVDLEQNNDGSASFITPDVESAETLVFSVTVTDPEGATDSDQIQIFVAPSVIVTGTLNMPRLIDAGSTNRGEVVFNWQPAPSSTELIDDVKYSIYASSLSNFDPLPEYLRQTDLTSLDGKISGLESGITYYLRIVAERGGEKAISETYPVTVSDVEIELVEGINIVDAASIETELTPNDDGLIILVAGDNLSAGDVILNRETGAMVKVAAINTTDNSIQLEAVNAGAVFKSISIESRVKSK